MVGRQKQKRPRVKKRFASAEPNGSVASIRSYGFAHVQCRVMCEASQNLASFTLRLNRAPDGSACASRFLVHFFDVHYTTTTWNLQMRRFMEDVDILLSLFSLPFIWTWIKPSRIQLQEKLPTFDELSGSKIHAIKFERARIHFFRDVFTAVVVVVA